MLSEFCKNQYNIYIGKSDAISMQWHRRLLREAGGKVVPCLLLILLVGFVLLTSVDIETPILGISSVS